MSQKLYLNILRIGVYVSLISVFLVFKNFLFPFITSKQIFFNILVEILFVFWVALIVKYPEYRPKKNYIWFGLIAFFAATLLSCFTSVDFNLSFWGDIERMLGFFHILHFLAFYFIIISVFREYKDWKTLMIFSVIFAVIESINVVTGSKSYGTIGNSAYVSGYIIFNLYFTFFLFVNEKNKTLRWIYLIAVPFMLAGFRKANTTGAVVGLGFSFMILTFLYGVFSKNKKLRIATIGIFLSLVLFTGFVLSNRQSPFVRKYRTLNMVASINVNKRTFQTRLISWKAALKDFKNHPLLGTGHGNYAITFDKHFDPTFYNHTRGETYFDRAHNNVIDIMSTTGLLGLSTYLSIFFFTAFYLINGFRKKYIDLEQFTLLSALITAYFVQNLAVFDSLVTYMGLMITLGYIYWLYEKGRESLLDEARELAVKARHKVIKDRVLENKEVYALVLAGLAMLVVIYQYNYLPIKMLNKTIAGQRAWAMKEVESTIDTYREALSYDTVLDRDSRTSLLRLFINNMSVLKNLEQDKADKAVEFLVSEAKKNVDYNVKDSLNQMIYAQVLNEAANFYAKNSEKFMFYSDRALAAIDRSIEASPGRIPIFFQKSQLLLNRGETDKALETLEYAATLNEDYYDSFCYLGRTYLFVQNEEKGFEYMDQCIDKGGVNLLFPASVVKSYINHYVPLEDWPRTIALYERLTALEKNVVDNWIKLAKLYAQSGDQAKARQAVEKAVEMDPSISQYADEFLNSL